MSNRILALTGLFIAVMCFIFVGELWPYGLIGSAIGGAMFGWFGCEWLLERL